MSQQKTLDKFFIKKRTVPETPEAKKGSSPTKASASKIQKLDEPKTGSPAKSSPAVKPGNKPGTNATTIPGTAYGTALYPDLKAWKVANSSSKLKIYSWNVNGIKSTLKKNDFQNFMKDANPDILCLNETKTDVS